MNWRWIRKTKTDDAGALIALLERHAGVGLWDAVLHRGDPAHPASHWHWSADFRRLLGFTDIADFPDTMASWADRLHPDDAEATFAAFQASLADTETDRGYDVTYRLRVRDGSYRWFRAVGGVARDPSGRPIRACGSLIDIHDQRVAEDDKRETMHALSSSFQQSVMGVVDSLCAAVSEVRASADQVLVATHDAQGLSSAVSVAAHVEGIALAVRRTEDDAGASSRTAGTLEKVSERLQQEVDRFLGASLSNVVGAS